MTLTYISDNTHHRRRRALRNNTDRAAIYYYSREATKFFTPGQPTPQVASERQEKREAANCFSGSDKKLVEAAARYHRTPPMCIEEQRGTGGALLSLARSGEILLGGRIGAAEDYRRRSLAQRESS